MTRRADPVRTCIGCRDRAAASDLLRIVVSVPPGTQPVGTSTPTRVLTPDPRGRMPGRGAHLHPSPDCLALAERRRAFGRALRADGPLDLSAVRDWITATQRVETERPTREGGTTAMSAR